MLRTASSLPHTGLLTLGSDAGRFPPAPPACYRASWQLPGPDFHRQATTSLRTARFRCYVTASPPALLGARIARASSVNVVSPTSTVLTSVTVARVSSAVSSRVISSPLKL